METIQKDMHTGIHNNHIYTTYRTFLNFEIENILKVNPQKLTACVSPPTPTHTYDMNAYYTNGKGENLLSSNLQVLINSYLSTSRQSNIQLLYEFIIVQQEI